MSLRKASHATVGLDKPGGPKIHLVNAAVFLIRSYGTPNGTGRCCVAQCYDKTWATLVQNKIG